jgi:mRNA-degrading endonuclease YafQ of YafQ-DinJ toxin-antitoxin module
MLRKHPELDVTIEQTLQLLLDDPFHPSLETHKLKGKLAGAWACRAGYDLRIVFDFCAGDWPGEKDILLINMGSHDEVY